MRAEGKCLLSELRTLGCLATARAITETSLDFPAFKRSPEARQMYRGLSALRDARRIEVLSPDGDIHARGAIDGEEVRYRLIDRRAA